jgi:hypothetical protein
MLLSVHPGHIIEQVPDGFIGANLCVKCIYQLLYICSVLYIVLHKSLRLNFLTDHHKGINAQAAMIATVAIIPH